MTDPWVEAARRKEQADQAPRDLAWLRARHGILGVLAAALGLYLGFIKGQWSIALVLVILGLADFGIALFQLFHARIARRGPL